MKKYQILFFTILPFSGFTINLADLDIDSRVKQQIADGFALEESIREFSKNRTAVVVTIGGDNACDYRIGTTKIQDAINAHADVEIRIAINDTYNENLVINDNNVSLRGGYANCTDAANDVYASAYSRASIRGVTGAKKPTIKVLGNTQRNTIILDRLLITNGEGATANFPGGGVSTYQANAQISLNKVEIMSNNSLRGGGIAIVEGDTDITATDSILTANKAQNGGGFHCVSSDASFTMHRLSGIIGNTANGFILNSFVIGGDGGGIYLRNGCSFLSYSGTKDESNIRTGVSGNIAVGRGGGVYANGSIVTLFGHEVCTLSGICHGDDIEPTSLTNNRSNMKNGAFIGSGGGGGGAVILGTGTILNIYAGKVTGNETVGFGGAIYIAASTFNAERLSKACWSQDNCNYYANNFSRTEIAGGGAIYGFGGNINLTNVVFAYNRADVGTVLYSSNNTVSIRASLMYQNGNNGAGDLEDNYVINAISGTLDIHHSTIADNNANEAVLNSLNSDTEIVASIIHDASTGPILSADSTEVDVECSMLHEDTSVTSQAFTVVDDPKFRDRANQNYRLDSKTSPAIDYCYANTGSYRDIDFQKRGWDDPLVNNVHGPFDIGSYEIYVDIFANGFE